MRILIYLILITIVTSCTVSNEDRYDQSFNVNGDILGDSLSIDQIKINGLNLFIEKEKIINLFGQPDSITSSLLFSHREYPDSLIKESNSSMGNLIEHSVFHYPHKRFWVIGDSARFEYVEFANTTFVQLNKEFVVDKNTTLNEIKESFPLSYLSSGYFHTTGQVGIPDSLKHHPDHIHVRFYLKEHGPENVLYFYFENDKPKRLVLYSN